MENIFKDGIYSKKMVKLTTTEVFMNFLMIVLSLVLLSNHALANDAQESHTNDEWVGILLDSEGTPLCRFADEVQANPSWIDNEPSFLKSNSTPVPISLNSFFQSVTHDDVVSAMMDTRGEEASFAVLLPPVKHTLAGALGAGIGSGIVVGCTIGVAQGWLDDFLTYKTSATLGGLFSGTSALNALQKINKAMSFFRKIAFSGLVAVSGGLTAIPADYVCYNTTKSLDWDSIWDSVIEFSINDRYR